jgi:hypothetical protein
VHLASKTVSTTGLVGVVDFVGVSETIFPTPEAKSESEFDENGGEKKLSEMIQQEILVESIDLQRH